MSQFILFWIYSAFLNGLLIISSISSVVVGWFFLCLTFVYHSLFFLNVLVPINPFIIPSTTLDGIFLRYFRILLPQSILNSVCWGFMLFYPIYFFPFFCGYCMNSFSSTFSNNYILNDKRNAWNKILRTYLICSSLLLNAFRYASAYFEWADQWHLVWFHLKLCTESRSSIDVIGGYDNECTFLPIMSQSGSISDKSPDRKGEDWYGFFSVL